MEGGGALCIRATKGTSTRGVSGPSETGGKDGGGGGADGRGGGSGGGGGSGIAAFIGRDEARREGLSDRLVIAWSSHGGSLPVRRAGATSPASAAPRPQPSFEKSAIRSMHAAP
jgi:hypothetical protein